MKELYPLTAVIGALGLAMMFLFRTALRTVLTDRHIWVRGRHKITTPLVFVELEHCCTPVGPV